MGRPHSRTQKRSESTLGRSTMTRDRSIIQERSVNRNKSTIGKNHAVGMNTPKYNKGRFQEAIGNLHQELLGLE